MRRLDTYILKGFLASFLICLVSILALYVVVDLSTNLGEFIEAERQNPASFMASYYLYRIPLLFGKFCPIVALLAAAFTLTFLEKRNELTPIKASGISMRRFTLPLVVAAGVLSLLSLAFEEWVVPVAARRIYTGNIERSDPHLWYQLVCDREASRYLFYVVYFPVEARMEGVYVSVVDESMREREFIYADRGAFLESDGPGWTLTGGYRIRFDGTGRRLGPPEPFETMHLDTVLRPTDMENRARVDEMSLSSLLRAWHRTPSLYTLGVQLHSRAAFALGSIVLVLAGLPVILSGAHRHYFLGALATALVAGAYFGLTYLALSLGMNGLVPPFVAAWSPPVLFGALAAAAQDLMPT